MTHQRIRIRTDIFQSQEFALHGERADDEVLMMLPTPVPSIRNDFFKPIDEQGVSKDLDCDYNDNHRSNGLPNPTVNCIQGQINEDEQNLEGVKRTLDNNCIDFVNGRYSCSIQNQVIANKEYIVKEENDLFSFSRFPTRSKEEIEHKAKKEKHCIVFSVDKNIRLCGVGLQLVSAPKKVIFNLVLKNEKSKTKQWQKTVSNQVFKNISQKTKMLMLKKHINLEKGSEYLVMLSYYGGKSYLACGGKDILDVRSDDGANITFSFKDYEGKANAQTNVLGGVFGKFFFKVK